MSVETKVETITPEIAKEYLKCSNGNRRIRARVVDMLARDMRNGDFVVTNQGIGFTESGVFNDGHHRMFAVIKADMPVQMQVTRGMSDRAIYAIDRGQSRSIRDVFDVCSDRGDPETNVLRDQKMVSAISQLIGLNYGRNTKLSATDAMRVYKAFEQPINELYHELFTKKSYRKNTAPMIAAAIAAVACGVEPAAIERFLGVLNKDDCSGCENYNIQAPLNLRRQIDNARVAHVSLEKRKQYLVMQNAIYHFVNNTEINRVAIPSQPRYDVSERVKEAMLEP